MSLFAAPGLFLLLPLLCAPSTPQRCGSLYQQKKFLQAGDCFLALASSIKQAKLSETQRTLKGRALRNAAFAFQQAAQNTNLPRIAAYLRERSWRTLQQYLQEKLYESPHRKKSALLMLHRLKDTIRYTPLTIVNNIPNAPFAIQSYHFRAKGTKTWSQLVRPGSYTVQQHNPARTPPTRSLSILVKPGKPAVLVLSLSQPKARKLPPSKVPPAQGPPRALLASGALLGIGALSSVIGGILLGLGTSAEAERTQLSQKIQQDLEQSLGTKTPTADQANSLRALDARGRLMLTTGWALTGAGFGVIIASGTSLLLLLNANKATPRPPAPSAKTSSHSLELLLP